MCAERLMVIPTDNVGGPRLVNKENDQQEMTKDIDKNDIVRVTNLFAPKYRTKIKKLMRYLQLRKPFQISTSDMVNWNVLESTDASLQTSLKELIQHLIDTRLENKNNAQPIDFEKFLIKIDDTNKKWFLKPNIKKPNEGRDERKWINLY